MKHNFAAMSTPAVTIVLPAYNCSKYIGQCIDSLLNQTFADFELLIIDDGSTDDTASIIKSYSDLRIQYISNHKNEGLIYTLNRALSIAAGEYIARMDADDVALPERLLLQKTWLDENPYTSAVSCTIQFIDEVNNLKGIWKDDQQAISYKAIKAKMPWRNCVAHPTIMIRKDVALKYLYKTNQIHCEDYDLWLRLLADGLVIEKEPQNLLLYRNHNASVTGSILRKKNPFYKQYHCKQRFLLARLHQGKWGTFETRVLFATIHDGLMGAAKQLKTKAKH